MGACDALHGLGMHIAAVNAPRLQLDMPETVYPLSHVGWQDEPEARFEVQFPFIPFVGACDASHGLGLHVAAVNVPAVQYDLPDAVCPPSHDG